MNIDTNDKEKSEKFHFWINEISPKMSPYSHKLNVKLVEDKYIDDLDADKYKIYIRGVKNSINIYREENIPLFTKMETKQQEYGSIAAKMNIEVNGEKLTIKKHNYI